MTDNVNVVLSVTERGLDSVQRDVEALRSELEALGIDMQSVERRLTGIERGANTASRAVRQFATATRESARATTEETRAQERAERATNQRARAERDLQRARIRSTRNAEFADFDQQFQELTRLTGAQENYIAGRYALYDVAAAYAAIGTALAGASIYAVTVGAQFESAFTNVARTLDTDVTVEQIDAIRASLVQLSGQIPLTFAEISQIATLGNQLGLASDEVVDFTNTVARFASVSGLSVDAVANSFGGFLAQTGLSAEYLENLGSSIALVGINSNATEAQIVSLVRELAAGAARAGFTADQIVGLAGALASFQVAPERARGVLDTYFATLNRAVAEGGDRLQTFANITGRTNEEISTLVRSGAGAQVFRELLQGIQNINPDAAELTQILDGIGLSGLRASNTFQRFLGNLRIADQAFEDAYTGFMEGAELQRQYGQTLDDLNSQFTIFINGLNALTAALSGGAVDSLAGLFAGINNVIFAITDFVNENRFIATLAGIGIATTAIIGGFILFRSVLTIATASIYAARAAVVTLGEASFASAGTVRGLATALYGVRGGATAAAGGIFTLRSAIRALLASTGVGLLLTLGGELLGNLFNVGGSAESAALSLDEYNRANAEAAAAARGAAGGGQELSDVLAGGGGSGGKDSVKGAADAAADSLRTLVDYASDVNSVFRRSSELRFGPQDAFDDITLAWIRIREEAEKYQQTVRSLTADRALQTYFLEIAELYNDQVRAGEIRENIAEIDDKLAEAQAGASTELEGNSKAAIENRKVFRDLLGSYEDYVSALASAGASQEQIQQVISQLNTDFGAQASALGYNSREVLTYQERFTDLGTIIAELPRDITLGYDPNPARQALAEFFAEAEERARQAGQSAGDAFSDGFGGGGGGGGIGGLGGDAFVPVFQGGIDLAPDYGKGAGDIWFQNLLDALSRGDFGTFFSLLGEGIEKGFEPIVTSIENTADGFTSYWEEQFGEIGDLFTNPGDFLPKWFEEQIAEIQGFFEGIPTWFDEQFREIESIFTTGGINVGGRFSGGVSSALNQNNSISNWLNGQNANAFSSGRTVGTNIGGGIAAGIASALGGRQVGATFAKGYSDGGYVGGGLFASGGYTGAGHWLQPAGIVHKGEYVVPKRHVDQATGLPSVDYVASLQRGKSAPKGGYATGGYVSGGGNGPIELGAGTINAIVGGLRVDLNVSSERLARATSRGDRNLSWQGSN